MPGGEATLEAVAELERRWVRLHEERHDRRQPPFRSVPHQFALPPCPPENCFDVVIAGGGLGLLAGAALASRGLRVFVFDRERVGAAHREWNISARELGSLVSWGLFTEEELRGTVTSRYAWGVISFNPEGTGVPACPLEMRGVLDLALDAQRVLDLARRRFLEAGGVILEERTFVRLHTAERGPVASVFELHGPKGTEHYHARLAIDTMGSVSPIAMGLNNGLPFDGVCPTVGTVLEGLDHDPDLGDVLVSVAPAEMGRQLIWEGFPGATGETTVYLFYYDRTGREEAAQQSLLDLFERYFALLPTYRRLLPGHRHLKPLFGYIPARHGRPGRTAARGLVCLGDSAAGQSPLTFCGFGSFMRHIGRVAMLLDFAIRHNLLEEHHLSAITPHQPNLRVAWVFSRFMQPWPGSDPAAVNRIMNVFCKALQDLGPAITLRFLQDRYTFPEYLRIMLTTARHYPRIFALTARVLGPQGLARWLFDMAAFALHDLLGAAHGLLGARRWHAVERLARKRAPALALRIAALRSYRQATR
jgi:lycopene cyclase CruA